MATDDKVGTPPERPLETCAHCGAAFEPGVRYPTTSRRDDDGRLELFAFCDEACQTAWRADQ